MLLASSVEAKDRFLRSHCTASDAEVSLAKTTKWQIQFHMESILQATVHSELDEMRAAGELTQRKRERVREGREKCETTHTHTHTHTEGERREKTHIHTHTHTRL